MGRIVIAAYRPKPGQADALSALVDRHLPALREQNLATDRAPIVMQAGNGTIVEVFEWASSEAIEAAHSNIEVQALWARFAEVCDFVPIGAIEEASQLFSEFESYN